MLQFMTAARIIFGEDSLRQYLNDNKKTDHIVIRFLFSRRVRYQILDNLS